MTATEKPTGPAPAEGAKYGAGAAGRGALGTGGAAGPGPEAAAAVEAWKWRKVRRGFYVADGTGYAAAAEYAWDGDGADGGDFTGTTEWAAIEGCTDDDATTGQNLDWFPTLKEAKAACAQAAKRTLGRA